LKLLDIFLLIILAWGGYSGFNKGLILEIFSVGALALAAIGSIRLLDKAVEICARWNYEQKGLLPYIIFVSLFVIILITTTWMGRFFKALIKPTLLGGLDRLLGSILGILKWGVYSSTCLWLSSLLQLKIPEAYTNNTVLFPIIKSLAPQLLAWCATWLTHFPKWFSTHGSISV